MQSPQHAVGSYGVQQPSCSVADDSSNDRHGMQNQMRSRGLYTRGTIKGMRHQETPMTA
jgi:hypothetical protein